MESIPTHGFEVIDGAGRGGESPRAATERDAAAPQGEAADPLTGLLSREGLEPVLEREWNLARRRAVSSILLVADVDRFKRINEEGTDRGDRALKLVARVLTESCRASDVVARVGGDDFVVILVGAKGDQPSSYVDRVTERLARDERAPTVSYGWTKLINATDPKHAIDLAEALLYKRRAVSKTRAV